jgi:hypothetical protein
MSTPSTGQPPRKSGPSHSSSSSSSTIPPTIPSGVGSFPSSHPISVPLSETQKKEIAAKRILSQHTGVQTYQATWILGAKDEIAQSLIETVIQARNAALGYTRSLTVIRFDSKKNLPHQPYIISEGWSQGVYIRALKAGGAYDQVSDPRYHGEREALREAIIEAQGQGWPEFNNTPLLGWNGSFNVAPYLSALEQLQAINIYIDRRPCHFPIVQEDGTRFESCGENGWTNFAL